MSPIFWIISIYYKTFFAIAKYYEVQKYKKKAILQIYDKNIFQYTVLQCDIFGTFSIFSTFFLAFSS